jgi:hypothetical protein
MTTEQAIRAQHPTLRHWHGTVPHHYQDIEPPECVAAILLALLDEARANADGNHAIGYREGYRDAEALRDPFSVRQGECGHLWRKVDTDDCPMCSLVASGNATDMALSNAYQERDAALATIARLTPVVADVRQDALDATPAGQTIARRAAIGAACDRLMAEWPDKRWFLGYGHSEASAFPLWQVERPDGDIFTGATPGSAVDAALGVD